MEEARIDLAGRPLEELEALLSALGKERYRSRQLFRWLYRQLAPSFDGMTDLSREFRERLEAGYRIGTPPTERVDVSRDGTEKYLFRLDDGEGAESVLIPDEGRRTLCISSQAGCALGCRFCATGAAGFRRDMTSSEIVHQVRFAEGRLRGRGEHVTNIVFMGMGEPLLNLAEVRRVLAILLSPHGFSLPGKRVTVSTAGVVPAMLEVTRDFPVSLAVSVNAVTDSLRSEIMPVNRSWPLAEVVAAMRSVPLRPGRKVTAEYVLLGGVNDSEGDARELARLFRGSAVKVNLIPFNPHEWSGFASPTPEAVERFRSILLSRGVQTITRERRGDDIAAACGQLRGRVDGPAPPRDAAATDPLENRDETKNN
jgi:23S rRNA (adenine2503-C2)-methyltransferase